MSDFTPDAVRASSAKRFPKNVGRSRRRFSLKKLPIWQRLALGVLLAPFVVTGAAACAYYYNLHQTCAAMTLTDLPVASPITVGRRMLVLSPHCDDETLGVGGQIAEARKTGIPVTVGFLTNGDGFRIAASRSLHKVNVGPSDFIRFAELRQHESVAALGELGVPASNVQFLGYPDRGLRPMWETNWVRTNPFRSGFTDSDHSPYTHTFTPGAPYAGESLVDDLVRLMETTRPTDILVTHPADDHPDHSAAASFTEAAFRVCQSRGDDWATHARIHYYIVHRGDWPLPQGSHPDAAMLPPPGLVTTDARWTVCPLTDDARKAKARALAQYNSQTGVTGRFLTSFVRTNELRIDLPMPETGTGAVIATGASNSSPGGISEISACETAAANLYGDNLARYVEPAGDITDLSVRRSGDSLLIRLRTRSTPSSVIKYAVLMRACETLPNGKDSSHIQWARIDATVPKCSSTGDGKKELVATIPLSTLGLDHVGHDRCVWVSAESRWMNRLPVIDWTGYREFRLDSDADRVQRIKVDARPVAPAAASPTHSKGKPQRA